MRIAIFLAVFLLPTWAAAEPSELVIQKRLFKKQGSDRYINAVHKELRLPQPGLAFARYSILQGMLATKGYAWTYEGEGDGYILARFDYRGKTAIVRIEYNNELIQLKYFYGTKYMRCINLHEGICYKADRAYTNYIKNLRKSIAAQLST